MGFRRAGRLILGGDVGMMKKVKIPIEELQHLKREAEKAMRYDLAKAIEFMILKNQLVEIARKIQRERRIRELAEELKIPWVITDEQK